jgi:hypothetical protein
MAFSSLWFNTAKTSSGKRALACVAPFAVAETAKIASYA